MELTHHDVHEILRILEHSDVGYLEVEVGDTRVVADRGGGLTPREAGRPTTRTAVVVEPSATRSEADDGAAGDVARTADAGDDAAADAATNALPEDSGLVTVPAPVVGVFYSSPEPGATPFTDEGAHVDEGATLGLVEVMKMFNSVTAPVAGHVVRVLVGNADFVEFGQSLMTIRPDEA